MTINVQPFNYPHGTLFFCQLEAIIAVAGFHFVSINRKFHVKSYNNILECYSRIRNHNLDNSVKSEKNQKKNEK